MFGDDRDTVYKTSYADNEGTEALTNYLQHDNQTVRDRAGCPMSETDLEEFNERPTGNGTDTSSSRHAITPTSRIGS